MKNLKLSITRSALWSAYGDILGFPTELISESQFVSKYGKNSAGSPLKWSRRVGGMFGPEIEFPSGTYSDDTQLRLSTSRAIRGDGYFDAESFAKIELPVWLNYALGAGRGSKAAAANLALKDTRWSQNFFTTPNSTYWNGGGNGAAMRIQPHIWCGHGRSLSENIADVVRNAICTHGHPRGIIGAAIHAGFLHVMLNEKETVRPDVWEPLGSDCASIAYETLVNDEELSLVWVPYWERASKIKLKDAWAETISEWVEASQYASKICLTNFAKEKKYFTILNDLGGLSAEERGSGLKTQLFASVLAWLYKDEGPEAALRMAAKVFNSDTDSIATMAGALMGGVWHSDPEGPIQDENYIRAEAERLYNVGAGIQQPSFDYPNLLSWSPPKNQSSALSSKEGRHMLMGLGDVELFGESKTSTKGAKLIWQWGRLSFGQTVLTKRRDDSRASYKPERYDVYLETHVPQREFPTSILSHAPSLSLNERTQACIKSKFDPRLIGENILELATGEDGIERCIAFAAIIAKAKIARES